MLKDLEQSDLPVLISVNICPFVHRTAILLTLKGREFQRITIDLSRKPEWFLQLSPLGKVPALFLPRQVTNGTQSEVLFESAVINEYLDECSGEPLLRGSPLEKARQRSWIAYSEHLIFQQYQLMLVTDAQEFMQKSAAFLVALEKFRPVVRQIFSREDPLNMLDVAVAPLFTRLRWLDQTMKSLIDASKQSADAARLLSWIVALQEHPAVLAAMPERFDTDFAQYFSDRRSYAILNAKALYGSEPTPS